jgi:hypothetical protein
MTESSMRNFELRLFMMILDFYFGGTLLFSKGSSTPVPGKGDGVIYGGNTYRVFQVTFNCDEMRVRVDLMS